MSQKNKNLETSAKCRFSQKYLKKNQFRHFRENKNPFKCEWNASNSHTEINCKIEVSHIFFRAELFYRHFTDIQNTKTQVTQTSIKNCKLYNAIRHLKWVTFTLQLFTLSKPEYINTTFIPNIIKHVPV